MTELRLTKRMVEKTGIVLPAEGGEVFIDYETLEALSEVSSTDLAFGLVQAPFVPHHAAQALVAAGLARQSTRGSYYGTDALTAFLQQED